jgi:hypothetical protein
MITYVLLLLLLLLLQVLVSEGGVPYLVHGLVHPDIEVSCCCSEMLARLASTHQQQPLDAVRSVARWLLHACTECSEHVYYAQHVQHRMFSWAAGPYLVQYSKCRLWAHTAHSAAQQCCAPDKQLRAQLPFLKGWALLCCACWRS